MYHSNVDAYARTKDYAVLRHGQGWKVVGLGPRVREFDRRFNTLEQVGHFLRAVRVR